MTVHAQVRLFPLVNVMIQEELVTQAAIIALVKQVQHVVPMITSTLAINVQIPKMESCYLRTRARTKCKSINND